jgi:hypothetical protein
MVARSERVARVQVRAAFGSPRPVRKDRQMDLRRWSFVLCVASGLSGCVAEYQPVPDAADAVPAQQAEVAEYDPFTAEQPALIADALQRQAEGKLLAIDIQRELFDYGQANVSDPRPWLPLARDSMAREWAGFAVRQYGLALRADARVARTHNVLTDVLLIAVDYTGVEESDANELLQEFWGVAALPELDRVRASMEAEGHEQAANKLTLMREAIVAAAG